MMPDIQFDILMITVISEKLEKPRVRIRLRQMCYRQILRITIDYRINRGIILLYK